MRPIWYTFGALIVLLAGIPCWAVDLTQEFDFHVAPQPLAAALIQFSSQADVQVIMDGKGVSNMTSPGVLGRYSVDAGLQRLLKGTGLTYRVTGEHTISVVSPGAAGGKTTSRGATVGPPDLRVAQEREDRSDRRPVDADGVQSNEAAEPPADEVVVTGSHIRGGSAASPVITITQQQIVEAGQTNLGDVVRSIPQSFAGGQNPGVSIGATSGGLNNQNDTGASTINLRGLGPDATLTLLNGRRLSYDGFTQGIDLSVIPIAALDRIEIVADGASAIYGSDAVAGVANIILKPDYEGVTTSARLGTATEGGDLQEQYGIVGGHRWSGGGFIATFDFERDTAIYSSQRSYTTSLPDPNVLLSGNKTGAVILSGHQDIGEVATFSVDSLYNRRQFYFPQTLTPGAVTASDTDDKNYLVSPTITLHLPAAWTVAVNGSYARDESFINNYSYATDGTIIPDYGYCYCNGMWGAEADADGPLFALPAGEVRVAVGSGYREDSFNQTFYQNISGEYGKRESYYGFGELAVPLAAPEEDIPGIHKLSASGALRYEHYSDMGAVTTPKLGIVYAPIADLDLKGSWGKSFKAPTLAQQYESADAILFPAGEFGATGSGATQTTLLASGGNLNLQPERATTWSTTLTLHPVALPAFNAELSYFNVSYTDRVMQPVNNLADALSDPIYREFLTFNPTIAQQQQVIAASPTGLTNYTGAAYNPANVFAIIDDLNTNVAIQAIHGEDLSASYRFDLPGGSLTVSDTSSWLVSRQQNGSLTPVFDLAGTIYNPPHFRSRTGATWKWERLTVSSFVNYIGGVADERLPIAVAGGSMTTVDMAVLYSVGSDAGLLRDVDVSFSVQNLTDAKPPYLLSSDPYVPAYDSTNYSAIGRFVNLSLAKHW